MIAPTCVRRDWTSHDGEIFSYSTWSPELLTHEKSGALVIAVHGLSGAALDYEPLGSHLALHGITTVALELRGQGNDPLVRRRGDLALLEDWYQDLRSFFPLMRKLHPDLPVYYYGESMGAALLVRFVTQAGAMDQPAGLMLASPVVSMPQEPEWWQQAIFRLFLFLRPTHRVKVGRLAKPKKNRPAKRVTRDEAHRRWFETAPHKIDRYTIRFFKCLFDLIEGCLAVAPLLKIPVLVLYAAHDVFIPPARVKEFFERIGSSDKQLRFFPEAYHLLLHDDDRHEALAEIERWLLPRLAG